MSEVGIKEGAAPLTGWPYPRIVAHRGGGKLGPENTLAGIEAGLSYGMRMIEFDAKLSADDTVFLLHDDRVDRTSNGHGEARAMRYDALRALDAGSECDPRFAGAWMPTLAEVAQCCLASGLLANIEIKPCPERDTRTGRLVARAATSLWQGSAVPPLLSSFSYTALHAAMLEAPHLPRGMLYEVVPEDWLEEAQALGCVSLHASHRHLNATLVSQIKSAGLRILAYTVNTPSRARELADWGVDAICTDRIDLIGPDFFA